VLCSGYPSRAAEHRALFEEQEPLELPSLHIFGTEGNDRQVRTCGRERLREVCDEPRKAVTTLVQALY